MPRYYFTFGQKYRHEVHPKFGDAHPDGYVVIEARDADAARLCAFENLGERWAAQYSEPDFEAALYPRGVLATLEAR